MSAALQSEAAADDAERFLHLLAPGEPVTFQTFGEGATKGRRDLSHILHGSLAQHAGTLASFNARGAGVYWMPNRGDGKGRKAGNVRGIRALFVDLDGAPLEPVRAAALQPHCIVESSPGRWHAYWRVVDCPPGQFSTIQKRLAARFNGDGSVIDLPRVMRLPGFDHRKGKPFASHLIAVCDKPPYTLAELVEAFDLRAMETPEPVRPANVTPLRTRKLPDTIREGERNATLFSLARGLVQKGHDAQAVNDRLRQINAERCQPPLGADEVDTIAAQAVGYGSDGFVMLPHKLLDSSEWFNLPPPAHTIIALALRRYNGANNGNIALTWADFKGRGGFGSNRTFLAALAVAVQSGILLRVRESGRWTQQGKKPALYAIASKWLTGKSRKMQNLHHAQSAESAQLHR